MGHDFLNGLLGAEMNSKPLDELQQLHVTKAHQCLSVCIAKPNYPLG